MKTRFLRWWYRVTGAKANAEDMRRLARMLDYYSSDFGDNSGRMMNRWQREYGHIYDLYQSEPAPVSRKRNVKASE